MFTKTALAIQLVTLSIIIAPASAADVKSACLSAIERNGIPTGMTQEDVDTSCSCLAASVSGDIETEILELAELPPEEVQSQRSPEAGEAIDSCFAV